MDAISEAIKIAQSGERVIVVVAADKIEAVQKQVFEMVNPHFESVYRARIFFLTPEKAKLPRAKIAIFHFDESTR